MTKGLETYMNLLGAGLLLTLAFGCAGPAGSAPSAGGITADKYYADAADRVPTPAFGQKKASPGSASGGITPEKYTQDASDRLPDPFLGKDR